MDFTPEEIAAELKRRGMTGTSVPLQVQRNPDYYRGTYEPSTRTEGHLNAQGELPGSREDVGTEADRIGGEDKFVKPPETPGLIRRLTADAAGLQDRLLNSASFGAYGAAQRVAREHGIPMGASPADQAYVEEHHPYLASSADAIGMLPKATPAGAVAEMTGRATDALLARVVAKRALESKLAQRVALPAIRGAATTFVNNSTAGRPTSAGDLAMSGAVGPVAEGLPKAAQAGAALIERTHPIISQLRTHGLEPRPALPWGPSVRPIEGQPGAPDLPLKATQGTRAEAARAGGDAALEHEAAIKDANSAAYGARETAALAREGDNWVNVRPLVERIDSELSRSGTDDATGHALLNFRKRLLNPNMGIVNGGQPYMKVRDLWDLKGYLRTPSKLGAPGTVVQPNKAPFMGLNSHMLDILDNGGPVPPKPDRFAHIPDIPQDQYPDLPAAGERPTQAALPPRGEPETEAGRPHALVRREARTQADFPAPRVADTQVNPTMVDTHPVARGGHDETAIQYRGAAPELAALDREYFGVNQDQRKRLELLGTTQKAGTPSRTSNPEGPSEKVREHVSGRISQEAEVSKAGGKGVVGGKGRVERYEIRANEPRMMSGTDVPAVAQPEPDAHGRYVPRAGLNEALERPQLHLLQERLQFAPGHAFGTAKAAARGRLDALLDEPGQLRLVYPTLGALGRVDTGRVPAAVDTLTQAIATRRQQMQARRKKQDEESQP